MQLIWPDRLRNLATFLVVAIHVAASVAMNSTDFHTFWWRYGNFWNSLARPGVPIFVMLSGYLLLGKDYPTAMFLKKRFSRVLVPSLFWMLVYCFYNFLSKGYPNDPISILKTLFEGPVHFHLWFIYLILGLYLLYPILRPWVRQAKDSDFFYLFICCALASWGYKIADVFFDWQFGLAWDFFSNNTGYFVLGYYLGTKTLATENTNHLKPWNLNKTQMLVLSILLISIGTAATMAGAFWTKTCLTNPSAHNYFYDYLTPNVGIAAAGWFLLARHFFNDSPILEVELKLSECSFGIYFLHIMVLDWMSEAGFWHSMKQEYPILPGLMWMCFLFSFAGMLIIRVLPFGKRVT